MKPGCAEKQCFKFRQIVFRACLGCFQSTQNWIELGTWNIVLPFIIWWKLSPAQLLPPGFELATFKPEDWHSNHCATGPLPVENSYCTLSLSLSALVNLRDNFSGSDFFSPSPWKMKHIFSSGIAGVKPGSAKKHFFRDLRNYFFRHCPYLPLWNSLTPGFTKKKALKNCVFACPLLNLPTPPRYLV